MEDFHFLPFVVSPHARRRAGRRVLGDSRRIELTAAAATRGSVGASLGLALPGDLLAARPAAARGPGPSRLDRSDFQPGGRAASSCRQSSFGPSVDGVYSILALFATG